MSVREKVEEILAAGGEEAEVVKDVLRALALFHGVLWESEVAEDIMKMRDYRVPYVPTADKVRRAIEILSAEGLVKVEERVRGSLTSPSTYRDRLLKLVDMWGVREALLRDPVYLRAYSARMRALKDAVGPD